MPHNYRISVIKGVEPLITVNEVLGFMRANTKAKAIAQASKQFPEYPHERIIAEAKSEVNPHIWEIETELFPQLPNICAHPGCDKQLAKQNVYGYCLEHREYSEKRKKRK